MPPKFRFGVMAAVSSDVQAREDRASLSDQIKTARAAGLAQGGVETIEPFVLDGFSRTGYINLSDALGDIPPLRAALEAVEQNKIDVLVIDNIERFGDLAPMIYTFFHKHKKQIHSARQATPIHEPKSYDPHADESSSIMMHVEGIIQKYRQNKMRRGWALGIPARVENGLHALRVPFGYRITEKDKPAKIVPEEAELLIQMKNRMLSGQTYAEIGRWADKHHADLHSARWRISSVRRTLENPFYAGIIRFGITSHRKATNKSTWKFAKGRHEALWDEDTYHAILAESKRRAEGKKNYNSRYPLSGLITCGVCSGKVGKHGGDRRGYMYCQKYGAAHWFMRYDDAFDLIVTQFIEQYQAWQAAPYEPIDITPLQERLKKAQGLRAQIHSDREAGIYTQEEAVAKINRLEDEQENIKRMIAEAEERNRAGSEYHSQKKMDPHTLENYIYTGDVVTVNHLLGKLISKIVVTGDKAEVVWRE